MATVIKEIVFLIETPILLEPFYTELKNDYLQPTMDFFKTQDSDESNVTHFAVVFYHNDGPPSTDRCVLIGPLTNPNELNDSIERTRWNGGVYCSYGKTADALATAHCCFDTLASKRNRNKKDVVVQRHCILMCHNAPYSGPATQSEKYNSLSVDTLTHALYLRTIKFSVICLRKVKDLFAIFLTGVGRHPTAVDNYAANPRHVVLLKGYQLLQNAPWLKKS